MIFRVNSCTYSLAVFCKYLYLLTQAQSTLCTGSLLCLVTADILLSFYLSGNQTTACSLATCPTYATDVQTGKTSLSEEKKGHKCSVKSIFLNLCNHRSIGFKRDCNKSSLLLPKCNLGRKNQGSNRKISLREKGHPLNIQWHIELFQKFYKRANMHSTLEILPLMCSA